MQPWAPSFAADYYGRGKSGDSTPQTENRALYVHPSSLSVGVTPTPSYNNTPKPFTPAYQSNTRAHQGLPPPPPVQPVQPHVLMQPAYTQPQVFPPHTPDGQQYANHQSASLKDRREDPDVDEDFPSYEDIRKMFVRKQQTALGDATPSNTKLTGNSKYPPPLPRKPLQRVLSNPESRRENNQKPQPSLQPFHQSHGNAELNHQWNQPSDQKPPLTAQRSQQVNYNTEPTHEVSRVSNRRPSLTIHSVSKANPEPYLSSTASHHNHDLKAGNNFIEIPVQHIPMDIPSHRFGARLVNRNNPPLHVKINGSSSVHFQDDNSPRVLITSNTPMSPQRAVYCPDAEAPPANTNTQRHSFALPPTVTVVNNMENEPGSRRSYAEIKITGNYSSLPRNFSVRPAGAPRRAISVVRQLPSNEENEVYPTFSELKSQFKQKERSNPLHLETFGVSFIPQDNIHLRDSQINRMSSQTSFQQPSEIKVNVNSKFDQLSGWNARVLPESHSIRTGPRVHQVTSSEYPGKRAAHVQYNSPMSLYSTKNAQEALNNDREASQLLKITGSYSKVPTNVISPTLQAVLQEDFIKRKTGHSPDLNFYLSHQEYGPGVGPLRQYEESPDSICSNITAYNAQKDQTLTYQTWQGIQ